MCSGFSFLLLHSGKKVILNGCVQKLVVQCAVYRAREQPCKWLVKRGLRLVNSRLQPVSQSFGAILQLIRWLADRRRNNRLLIYGFPVTTRRNTRVQREKGKESGERKRERERERKNICRFNDFEILDDDDDENGRIWVKRGRGM